MGWGGAGPGRGEGTVWGADPAWASCPGPTCELGHSPAPSGPQSPHPCQGLRLGPRLRQDVQPLLGMGAGRPSTSSALAPGFCQRIPRTRGPGLWATVSRAGHRVQVGRRPLSASKVRGPARTSAYLQARLPLPPFLGDSFLFSQGLFHERPGSTDPRRRWETEARRRLTPRLGRTPVSARNLNPTVQLCTLAGVQVPGGHGLALGRKGLWCHRVSTQRQLLILLQAWAGEHSHGQAARGWPPQPERLLGAGAGGEASQPPPELQG